jgi:hypothetical protein
MENQTKKQNKILAFFSKINQKWLKFTPRSTAGLTNVEEKYDFPATHIIGHVGTIVGVIVCIVGLGMIIWGLTPVIKRSVSAPKMQEQQEVTAQQVQECAQNMKPAKTSGPRRAASRRVVNQEVEEESEAMPPDVSLDKLQEAMPAVKLTRPGRKLICEHSEGHYEYGDFGDWIYPSRCYVNGKIDTKVGSEIHAKLQRIYPYDSVSQQVTADNMADRLMRYQESSRLAILRTSLNWLEGVSEVDELWALWEEIDAVIGNASFAGITLDVDKVFDQFADFMLKNAATGRPIFDKLLKLVKLAQGQDRLKTFKTARAAYKEFLNLYYVSDEDYAVFVAELMTGDAGYEQFAMLFKVGKPEFKEFKKEYKTNPAYKVNGYARDEWHKATDKFFSMTQLHSPADFYYNMTCFYDAFVAETKDRVAENYRLLREYNEEREQAKKDAEERAEKQKELVPQGKEYFKDGFLAILIIIIALALFSLQRSLKRLESALVKNSQNNEKQGE